MININSNSKTYSNEVESLFKSIGFTIHKDGSTEIGSIKEYKYYSPKLVDNHYNLVLFKHNEGKDTDFRLYVHKNENGSYVDCPFQVSTYNKHNKKYILHMINKLFDSEIQSLLRDDKLETLLCE